ncbi:MAG: cell envelope integrity protein CreD [Woeseiaceae bacterium]|nr:cell envelope integrity protein CreD [Woeseiaceae bacterium]
MQQIISGLRKSASLKAATIGFLTLILLIPVAMIDGLVEDRSAVLYEARADIMRSWGGEQTLAGPVLVVPYTTSYTNRKGELIVEEAEAYVLPSRLNIEGELDSEIRARGIHEVPVYHATLQVSGTFDRPDIASVAPRVDTVHWERAQVALSVSEARGITETPQITINGASTPFRPGGAIVFGDMPPPVTATAGNPFAAGADTTAFELTLRLNGTDTLRIMPLGDTTDVRMSSPWPSPSFTGGYLPRNHDVSDDGFTAVWQVASLGRAIPSVWTSGRDVVADSWTSSLGVTLYMPVSIYQLMFRAVRYAVLFIALTFVAYFLFEIMAKLRLHPLQYLLVGFANAMFFLLLLSLAEHIGFGAAYLLSAFASIALVTGYSTSILGTLGRGATMAGALAVLYLFLYMTLKAETYALLAGAIGLWITLATIMTVTRRIDWYGDDN